MNTRPPRPDPDDLADLARRTKYRRGMLIELDDGTLRAVNNLQMAAALELTREARRLQRDAERFALALESWLNQGCPLQTPNRK